MLASALLPLLLAQVAPGAAVPPAATTPDLAIADSDERLTVATTVAGRGPFAFIVDTGAERTVVSHDLAAALSLAPGPTVSLLTMAGQAYTGTVLVPSLAAGEVRGRDIVAPVLDRANLGALGILGLDVLQGRTVTIDLERQVMTVAPSRRRRDAFRHDPDEIVVTGRNLFGQLVVTDARYHGASVRVVLDTGSAITVANAAFRRLAGRRHQVDRVDPDRVGHGRGDLDGRRSRSSMSCRIGGIALRGLPLAFAEVGAVRPLRPVEPPCAAAGDGYDASVPPRSRSTSPIGRCVSCSPGAV